MYARRFARGWRRRGAMPADRAAARRCKSVLHTKALSTAATVNVGTQTEASLPSPVVVTLRVAPPPPAPPMADPPPVPPRKRTTSAIAQGVLDACLGLDRGARLAYVGVDDAGRTTVRLCASASSSVTALQRTLRRAFPLARVATSENTLDGTMQAQIVVPNEHDEWSLAMGATRDRRSMQLLHLAAGALALAGCVAWAFADPPHNV